MWRVYSATIGLVSCLAVRASVGDYLITYTDLSPSSSESGGGLNYTSGNQQGGDIGGYATIWNGPSHSPVNLHPASATYSAVMAGAGNQQVGYTYSTFAWAHNAALWNGTVSSCRNLNPSWALSSMALATTGTRQAGYATAPGYQDHAGVWSGTASSFVDLNPAGASSSMAYAIAGNQQAGSVIFNGMEHAALWSGSAASFRDLNPGGQGSKILAMTTSQQVGYANGHAGIWFGTAESFVDINPVGAVYGSEANATIGTMQAGVFYLDPWDYHAVLWFGSADNYIDLQAALGSNYRASEAQSIWTDGSMTLVAGNATDWSGLSHPVLWQLTVVPEPGTASLLGLAFVVWAVAKRGKLRQQ